MNFESAKAGFANACLRMGVYGQSGLNQILSRFWRVLSTGAASIWIAALFYSGSLDDKYIYYSREPLPHHGQVVPYLVKGVMVYITKDESNLMSWLTRIEVISFVIAVIAALIGRHFAFQKKK
jgi:hypothetical protein